MNSRVFLSPLILGSVIETRRAGLDLRALPLRAPSVSSGSQTPKQTMASQRSPRHPPPITDHIPRTHASLQSFPPLAVGRRLRYSLSDTNLLAFGHDTRRGGNERVLPRSARARPESAGREAWRSPYDGKAVMAPRVEPAMRGQKHRWDLVQVLGDWKRRVRSKLQSVFWRARNTRPGRYERLHNVLRTKKELVSFPQFDSPYEFGVE